MQESVRRIIEAEESKMGEVKTHHSPDVQFRVE